MSIKIQLILLIAVITSCESTVEDHEEIINRQHKTEQVKISYTKFNPSKVEGIELDGFDIEDAFTIDSSIIIVAYSDGDLETSKMPENWGDGLIMMKNDSILFQSKAVGDPYQYEPNFFRNPINGKVIIICHLGNEESYGGEAFLFENGTIEFMGDIEMECPYETEYNTGLIDIIRVSEKENSIYFDFEADSLIKLTNDNWDYVKNDSIRYVFKDHTFTLVGL